MQTSPPDSKPDHANQAAVQSPTPATSIPTSKMPRLLIGGGAVIGILMLLTLVYSKSKMKTPEVVVILPSPESISSPATGFQQVTSPTPVSQKRMVAENDTYQVFILPLAGKSELTGPVTVVDRKTGSEYVINDEFTIFGEASIFDDSRGRYVGINTGTYITRGIDLISLIVRKKVASICVMHGTVYFYEDLVIFANCDTFDSLPWGAGEAPSIVAKNLKTGAEIVLFKSSETNYFILKSLSGAALSVEETYVKNVKDWEVTDPAPLSKTRIKSINLSQL